MSQPRPCRSCGEPVWLLLYVKTGKLSPIEVKASRQGDVLVDLEAGTWRFHRGLKPEGELYHANHFVNCPAAASWRRQAGRGG